MGARPTDAGDRPPAPPRPEPAASSTLTTTAGRAARRVDVHQSAPPSVSRAPCHGVARAGRNVAAPAHGAHAATTPAQTRMRERCATSAAAPSHAAPASSSAAASAQGACATAGDIGGRERLEAVGQPQPVRRVPGGRGAAASRGTPASSGAASSEAHERGRAAASARDAVRPARPRPRPPAGHGSWHRRAARTTPPPRSRRPRRAPRRVPCRRSALGDVITRAPAVGRRNARHAAPSVGARRVRRRDADHRVACGERWRPAVFAGVERRQSSVHRGPRRRSATVVGDRSPGSSTRHPPVRASREDLARGDPRRPVHGGSVRPAGGVDDHQRHAAGRRRDAARVQSGAAGDRRPVDARDRRARHVRLQSVGIRVAADAACAAATTSPSLRRRQHEDRLGLPDRQTPLGDSQHVTHAQRGRREAVRASRSADHGERVATRADDAPAARAVLRFEHHRQPRHPAHVEVHPQRLVLSHLAHQHDPRHLEPADGDEHGGPGADDRDPQGGADGEHGGHPGDARHPDQRRGSGQRPAGAAGRARHRAGAPSSASATMRSCARSGAPGAGWIRWTSTGPASA